MTTCHNGTRIKILPGKSIRIHDETHPRDHILHLSIHSIPFMPRRIYEQA